MQDNNRTASRDAEIRLRAIGYRPDFFIRPACYAPITGQQRLAPSSRTPRRAAARVAFHACAVSHQSEIGALVAHFALVAASLRLGTALHSHRLGVALRF